MWYLGSCMSSMSSDITYLVMEKYFPDTNMPDMRPFILYSISLRPSFPKLINYKPTNNEPYCVPHLRNEIKFINYRPTHNPTHLYFCAGDTTIVWYFHRAYYFNTGLLSPHECVNYWGQQNIDTDSSMTVWWLWNSGVYISLVCLFIYQVWCMSYYSGFARRFTLSKNYVMYVLLDHTVTHTEQWSYCVSL